MCEIALGFANTVDAELAWDAAHLENLIRTTGLRAQDIEEKRTIESLKDLLSSILFHLRDGSGCGMMISDSNIIEQFMAGARAEIALGGTAIRAALVIAALGGSAIVHLTCVNPETLDRLPEGVSWVGGDRFHCCYPHIAIQFPALARVRAGDIDIASPKANRVIYSGDIACAHLTIAPKFFEEAHHAKVLVLSSFDMILEEAVLVDCLYAAKRGVESLPAGGPLVFYEHACFTNPRFGALVGETLSSVIDVYSMNEDEFMSLCGRGIDLLDSADVRAGLRAVVGSLRARTVLIHTHCWVLAYGRYADRYLSAMEGGMAVAATRYRLGVVSPSALEATKSWPRQEDADAFARRIEGEDALIRCLAAYRIGNDRVTTVGLGDSFVGGFALAYARGLRCENEV